MVQEFINPNWHTLLLHFPIALLVLGVLIELLAFLWKTSSIRTAARWMILLGALSAVPAVTTGIYAFADAARGASARPDAPWPEIVRNSHWTDAHWTFMSRHIWLMSGATVLVLITTIGWIGLSDRLRRKMCLPTLALLVVGVAAMAVGGWYSGEAVYRYGVAVTPPTTPAAAAPSMADHDHTQHAHHPAWVRKYVPPMQVHLLLIGLTIAAAAAAIGTTFRRRSALACETEPPLAPSEPQLAERPTEPGVADVLPPEPASTVAETYVPPARFWLLTLILALATAAAGLWTAGIDWKLHDVRELIRKATGPAPARQDWRLFLHLLLGTSIIALTLFLAILTRFTRRSIIAALIAIILLLGAFAAQVFFGIKLLYQLL